MRIDPERRQLQNPTPPIHKRVMALYRRTCSGQRNGCLCCSCHGENHIPKSHLADGICGIYKINVLHFKGGVAFWGGAHAIIPMG